MQRKTNNNILVPTDFSDVASNALAHAVKVAETYKNEITLLNIIDEGFLGGIFGNNQQQQQLMREAIESRMDKIAEEIKASNGITVHKRIETGRIYKVIAEIANEGGFDSVIMGSHGANGLEQVIGSNASRTIQYAEVPVVVVKNKSVGEGYKKIVMPMDLSVESRQKVEWAIHLGKQFSSEIHVVYQGSSDEFTNNRINANIKAVEHLLRDAGVAYTSREIEDKLLENYATEIMGYSVSIAADLILAMTDTEIGIADMIRGTYTQQIVNKSSIPVMCIHPRETGFTYDY
jgi:nucleotide-binding universal stress UspA family protein